MLDIINSFSTMATCVICSTQIDDNNKITLGCNHKFHSSCVIRWFRSDHDAHGSCPLCRDDPGLKVSTVRLSASLARILMKQAGRKGSHPMLQTVSNEYRSVNKQRIVSQKLLKEYMTENKAVITTYQKMIRHIERYNTKERKLLRHICSMHPIIPLFVDVEEESL